LFFLNGIFLNITKGNHINVSQFKALDEIEVLSIEFFNHLLAYREVCEERANNGETYPQWYDKNFCRTSACVSSIERNLQDSFKDKAETRILDIWIDLPPQVINQYIN